MLVCNEWRRVPLPEASTPTERSPRRRHASTSLAFTSTSARSTPSSYIRQAHKLHIKETWVQGFHPALFPPTSSQHEKIIKQTLETFSAYVSYVVGEFCGFEYFTYSGRQLIGKSTPPHPPNTHTHTHTHTLIYLENLPWCTFLNLSGTFRNSG